MATIDEIHAASTIKEVQIAKLRVDRSYQRDPSTALVDEIAEDWDIVASELILVSDRGTRPEGDAVEGGLFVVNGQHRVLAARKLGHTKIWARVIDLRKEPDPGKLESEFRLKTNVRLGDRSHERFKAQLRAGNEESHAIVKILAKYDTEINLVPTTESGLNCISAIEQIFRYDDGGLLNETLGLLHKTIGHVGGKSVSSNSIKGTAWFIERHAIDVDQDRLVEKLQLQGSAAMERRARAMQSTMAGALWLNYYRVLVELYNEKLQERSRLNWSTRGAASFRAKRRGEGPNPVGNWGANVS